ncbi:PIGL family protein [Megaselia abdita]
MIYTELLDSFHNLSIRLEYFKWPSKESMDRVLFITSHPDDECMFFGPVIHSIAQNLGSQIYLLCLSHGNYEKHGCKRRSELWEACKVLGIPEENITLFNCSQLPDDPNIEWKVQTIANIISNTVDSLDIQAVITFDREGVSQHPNHTAVYYATASLCLNSLLPKDCKLFTLDSVNTFRKYISLLDLLLTYLLSTYWCVLSFEEASNIRNAMRKHHSQMKWFRWLYIFCSRYMFINSLRKMTISDIELEFQIEDSH